MIIVEKKTGEENSITQVNAFDPSSLYAFIAYWEDLPTYESFYYYYLLLPRVGLEKDDVITRQKLERKRGAAATYAAGNVKFAKDDL